MPTTITATERRLAEVFNDQYLFTIPLYQRPYAWTTEETGTLLDDLMNAVRRDLSPTDILKAEILGEIGREYQAEYAAKWEGIEEALGREEFRALFNHVRMIYKKDKQRETLQGEFRDGIVDTMTRRAFVDDVLEPYSNVFETISRAAYASAEDAEKVNALLRHLHMLDNVDWVPPLMVWFRWCSAAREHPLRFTRDLERLAYGLFIRRANVNERTKRYARVLECIERHDDLFGEGSPLQISRQEAADIVARLDGNIYEQPRIPTPLLLRMDSALAEGASRYHYSMVSVEHVLPQNPTADSQWVRWFPDTDERERWTHRLANLVLLSRRKNARASNYEFERKKQEYFQREGTTTFAVTTQVINEATWTPAVLERRQGELVAALKREWRLE